MALGGEGRAKGQSRNWESRKQKGEGESKMLKS
jgi:hypothetical protein